jgi:hypothetical protein
MLKALQILFLFLAVAFFLALVGLAYYSSPPPIYPSEQQPAAQATEKQPHEKQHTFSGLINFLFPDAISIFTFWLVVATIVLGIIAYVQIDFLRRAEGISAKIAQAAKDSAEAAKDAVTLSDKTAERQLRAYVFISKAEISDIMSNQNLTAKIAVRNFGQTPAYDVETSIGIQTAQFPLVLKLPMAIQKTKTGAVGPGGDIMLNFNGDSPSPVEWRPRFAQKGGAVYLYGTIKYVDAFKIPRFTNFRLYKGGDTGVSGPELTVSPDGNEAN